MSNWMRALESPNNVSARVLASKVLPTPVGPSKAKVPMGRRGSFKSARERRRALHKAPTASFWPMIMRDISCFERKQALGFAFLHALEGDAGPFGDDVQNVLLAHGDALFLAAGAPGGQDGFEFFLGLLFLVAHGGGAFEILVLDGPLLLGLDLLDVGLEVLDLGRAGHGADAGAGAGLIHDVDGLVGQVAVGDVAVGHAHGRSMALSVISAL